MWVGDLAVAPVPVVLRQIGYRLRESDVTHAEALDVIELALEHALRLGASAKKSLLKRVLG